MKISLRTLSLLLVMATVWGCQKDSATGSTPDPTPVLSLEQRLMKAGLTFYNLTPENFQATPFEKKDPPGLLNEKNVADIETALNTGKFKLDEQVFKLQGVKSYYWLNVDSKRNGIDWRILYVDKYDVQPSMSYTFAVVGVIVRENSSTHDENDRFHVYWKRK